VSRVKPVLALSNSTRLNCGTGLATDALSPVLNYIARSSHQDLGRTWVQSWVQLEGHFHPKNGVKLRQINESVDGS
jgi:hypothetical protein